MKVNVHIIITCLPADVGMGGRSVRGNGLSVRGNGLSVLVLEVVGEEVLLKDRGVCSDGAGVVRIVYDVDEGESF